MRRFWPVLLVLAGLLAYVNWPGERPPEREYLLCPGQGLTDDGRPCPDD
ncbi:hypothetical protein [Pararhodobacter sp. CCB-MM2]|nr:hypothetical protein [Pararhodobacter sp. CCB-MM2]